MSIRLQDTLTLIDFALKTEFPLMHSIRESRLTAMWAVENLDFFYS